MKVKKENNRFNAETVVANYHFGTLKGKSGEVCEVLCRRKVMLCIAEGKWSHAMHHRQKEVRLRRKDSGDK